MVNYQKIIKIFKQFTNLIGDDDVIYFNPENLEHINSLSIKFYLNRYLLKFANKILIRDVFIQP